MIVLPKVILCFFKPTFKVFSQEGYISNYSHFNTDRHFPRTNNKTSNKTSPNHDTTSFSLSASQTLMMIPSVYDPFFTSTFRAIKIILREVDIYVIFCSFQTLFTCILLKRGVDTDLTDIQIFSRRRHQIVLDSVVF